MEPSSSNSLPDSARQYTVLRYGPAHVCQIHGPNSSVVLYTSYIASFKTKNHKYDLTLHEGESDSGPIIGAARLSMITNTIKLAFGDPDGSSATWEDMRNKPFTRRKQYSLSIRLPTGERRVFEWKSTHNVEALSTNPHSVARKMEDFAYKIDSKHLKLVDQESGEVVARFIHCPLVDSCNLGKKGDVEIKRDFGGREWDKIVILSSLAIQESLQRGI